MSSFIQFSEMNTDMILCIIAVCLFFIVAWCMFDVLYRVFFSKIKVLVLLCCLSSFLLADWTDSDSDNLGNIYNTVQAIRSDQQQSVENVEYLADQEDLKKRSLQAAVYSSNNTNTGNILTWFGEMLYGTNLKREPGAESAQALIPSHSSEYDALFGLKNRAYKESVGFHLDFIKGVQSASNPRSKFDIETFVNDERQSDLTNNPEVNFPDGFLKASNSSDFLNKGLTPEIGGVFTDTDGHTHNTSTQQGTAEIYVTKEVNTLLSQDRSRVERLQHLVDGARKGFFYEQLDGTILSFNLAWVADMFKGIFVACQSDGFDASTVPTFDSWRNFNFVLRLVPVEGDFLYPLYTKWHQFDSIINASIFVVCVMTVLLFISDKIRALVEGS